MSNGAGEGKVLGKVNRKSFRIKRACKHVKVEIGGGLFDIALLQKTYNYFDIRHSRCSTGLSCSMLRQLSQKFMTSTFVSHSLVLCFSLLVMTLTQFQTHSWSSFSDSRLFNLMVIFHRSIARSLVCRSEKRNQTTISKSYSHWIIFTLIHRRLFRFVLFVELIDSLSGGRRRWKR